MATNRNFQAMLNDYITYPLLTESVIKRDYFLSHVEKDNKWKGGTLPVPFKGSRATSICFGSLTDSTDIGRSKFVRGEVSTQPEVWGSLIFDEKDLIENGKVSEQNFLQLLPDEIDDFSEYFQEVASIGLMGGPHFAKLTADSTANTGVITVDKPERFHIDQKVIVDDDATAAATGYVKTINLDAATIVLVTTRGGAVVIDFNAVNKLVAQNAKCYHDGSQSNGFTSLRSSLLSAANGGAATLYGQTKTAYPYLQAVNIDGTAVDASNIMSKLFDALTTVKQRGKGNPTDVIMSFKNFGSCLKLIETSKGAFNVVPDSRKASQYGWQEIVIGSVTGQLMKLVGVNEVDDDVIYFIDWKAMKFHTNGFFRKRKGPDGNEWYTVRATTGYYYIIDIALFGDLIVSRPSHCGIMHTVAY